MLTKDVKIKLYLEGLQISFLSINIQEQAGATAVSATVQVPATSEALNLLPRTQAHVFYKIDDKYYLIYEGELASVSYNQSAFSRNVSLNLVGVFNYFSQALRGMGAEGAEGDFTNNTILHYNYKDRVNLRPSGKKAKIAKEENDGPTTD